MVFSSIPPYLDPSSHWHHHLHPQQNQQLTASTGTITNPLNQVPPLAAAAATSHGGGGSIRPGSMAERARMANIPMPEAALKCPRCDSTNTKFCYFNNYSLSQPRHFCKTCRRYWTRGGALRSVPVGGGCRRNKKSKSTSANSKSPVEEGQTTVNPNSTNPPIISTTTAGGSLLGLTMPMSMPVPVQFPPLRFMPPPLTHLTMSDGFASELGLNYSGIAAPIVGTNEMNFHGATAMFSGGGVGSNNMETWRLQQIQQFPFLTGNLDPSPSWGIYQFNEFGGESSHNNNNNNSEIRTKILSSMSSQMASVKMEENPELRQLGNRLLNGATTTVTNGGWTDLSSFSSSSTSNPNL